MVGALVGAGVVVGAMYHSAELEIDALLSAPAWTETGRVVSAPMVVSVGMAVSTSTMADALLAAGYDRVDKVRRAGDFRSTADAIVAHVPISRGSQDPRTPGEVLITFAKGRIESVSPHGRAVLGPVELAAIRGPDASARSPIELDAMPEHLVHAVLAMEDARFYTHAGVDPLGILRALTINLTQRQTAQGGSTLTQQLVKNLFLSHERSYRRKAREALLALAMEKRLSKDQILTMYLNEIYLGQVGSRAVSGVNQGARVFFGKGADQIDVGEAATLAGIISAPNRYSPLRHAERALERRDLALDRMVAVGWLDPAANRAAKEAPLVVQPAPTGRRAPYLVDAAVETVEDAIGEGSIRAGGLTVHTTIQPLLQSAAEDAVRDGMAQLRKDHSKTAAAEVALVALRVSDGAVLAMVGGRNYGESQYNRVLHGRRQIGSTIKPLTMLFAFEMDPGYSPATWIADEPIERTVGGRRWAPENHDGEYLGDVTLRDAIVHSRNVPAVLLAEEVGLEELEGRYQQVGLHQATSLPSAALGAFDATPAELAGAYTVFPGHGLVASPYFVRDVRDASGKSAWPQDVEVDSRASARAAFMATDVLRDVIARGTGRGAAAYGVRGPVGGKTGTTDGARDAWFVGFTPELVVAVWVGFDKGRNLGLSGAQAALPIWARFISAAGPSKRDFVVPDDVVAISVCTESHAPAIGGCPEVEDEWFTASMAPEEVCELHMGPLGEIGQAAKDALERVQERFRRDESPVRKRKSFPWFRRKSTEE